MVEVVAKNRWTRFCSRGHDKDALGRIKGTASCLQCAKDRKQQSREAQRAAGLNWKTVKKQREQRGGGFKYAFWLPAAPLNEAVASYLNRQGLISDTTRRGAITYRSPLHALAARYAERFDVAPEAALRFMARLPQQTRITVDQADRVAILIGLHPAMIWPREWGESA